MCSPASSTVRRESEWLKRAMKVPVRATRWPERTCRRAEGGGPGPIEVRLLTFTPEIVGLAKPLSSNMAVRITELVAWLALHGSKGTTAESILDHGIAGATAIKTVYNMVSAARAALGVDATGSPRMITERSTGIYRLGEEVTVDVLRFEQMAERGIDTEDSQLAALLCEAALALIEDTPVGNGTGRYGWWSSMWEARIGRMATKAAGRLAELARHGVIDLEVARWGIERARLTAGGEEELHRVAMVLEAWAGNELQSGARVGDRQRRGGRARTRICSGRRHRSPSDCHPPTHVGRRSGGDEGVSEAASRDRGAGSTLLL